MKTLNQLIRYLATPRGLNSIYGHILQQTQQQIRPDLPAPAAVSVTPLGVWQLFWNPKRLDEELLTYQLLVLIHEAAHLSLNHITRGLRLLRREHAAINFAQKSKQFQYAADFAVNSLVINPLIKTSKIFTPIADDVQARWLFPDAFELPDGLSLEAYYYLLEDEENQKKVEEHSRTKETAQASSDIIYDVLVDAILKKPDSVISQTIRTTEQEALYRLERCIKTAKQSRGTVPSHITQEIDYLSTEAEIPWTSVLHDYARTALNERITECIASPNAGFLHLADHGCEPYPGFSLDTTLSLAVLVDSSGSISTEHDYKPFLRELAYLLDTHKGLHIHYIVFDAVVQEELCFTSRGREDLITHKLNVRPAIGGTSFLPPFKCAFGDATDEDYSEKLKELPRPQTKRPDLIIIMTDGYADFEEPRGPYPKYLNDGIPNIWVLTKNHTRTKQDLNKMQRIIEL